MGQFVEECEGNAIESTVLGKCNDSSFRFLKFAGEPLGGNLVFVILSDLIKDICGVVDMGIEAVTEAFFCDPAFVAFNVLKEA